MGEIERVLTEAARRLWLTDLLKNLVVSLAVAGVLAVLARAAQKLFPFDLPWTAAGLGLAIAAVLAAVVATAVRARTRDTVARELDERADLREALSTALAVRADDSPWSRAVVESAGERARRVLVRDAIPVRRPDNWWWVVAAAAALAAVWWLPSWDVAGLFQKQQARADEQAEIVRVREEIAEQREQLAELAARAGVELDEGTLDALEGQPTPEMSKTADDIRRSAIRELTSLTERLEARQDSPQAAEVKALQESFQRLRQPGPGPLSEMSRQLARGEFDQAKETLEKLAEQTASGELSEEAKQQAAEQLDKLAEQLDKLAEQRQQLEEQLRSAGLSAEQASAAAADPQALQQALENNQSLSEEQKQQLQNAAQAQQQASDALSSLSQSMGQMAQGMQNGDSQQMQGAMEAMASQLGQMEMASQELANAQAALSEAQRQLSELGQQCENPMAMMGQGDGGQSALGSSKGGLRAGEGEGMSLGDPQAGVDFALEQRKANVRAGDGPIIAQTLVYGSQVRGESRQAFRQAASAARAEAAEAIETKLVPKRYESAAQHYFGRLESVAGSAEQATTAEPAPTP